MLFIVGNIRIRHVSIFILNLLDTCSSIFIYRLLSSEQDVKMFAHFYVTVTAENQWKSVILIITYEDNPVRADSGAPAVEPTVGMDQYKELIVH